MLDWSVTPIRAPFLRPGDAVPDSVDLGLSRRWESSANVLLVDAPRRTVYRPLLRAPDSDYCLCTPIWLSQRSLRIGVTTLLQVAFPELPDALRTVDVDIPTVPQFWRVPVTPVGQVPVANRPTDLTRPAEVHPRVARSDMFRYGASEQVFRVRVHRVIAGGTFTSLEWAIVSVTGGDGVEAASGPPFASEDAATVTGDNPAAASGPVLHVGDDATILQARVVTNRLTSGKADECLCTDLRVWAAALRQPDKVATVVTNYPALPRARSGSRWSSTGSTRWRCRSRRPPTPPSGPRAQSRRTPGSGSYNAATRKRDGRPASGRHPSRTALSSRATPQPWT